MKKSIVYIAVIALSVIALAFATLAFTRNTNEGLKNRLENLSGTYADAKPYSYDKAWGKRVFTFDKGKWTLVFTLGLDPELKMQVFNSGLSELTKSKRNPPKRLTPTMRCSLKAKSSLRLNPTMKT